jgi:hypothetical protein
MFDDYLRDPAWAALFAAAVTIAYIHAKAHINNEQPPKTSVFMKPAALVGILVFYIVQNGVAGKEPILTEPF